MTIAVRTTATSSFGAPGATRSMTIPASTQVGDLIVVYWGSDDNGATQTSITAPGGESYTAYTPAWNTNRSTEDPSVHAFWKRAESGDAGQSHSFSISNSSWLGGICLVIQDPVAAGDPNDATPVANAPNTSNLTVVANDITPASQPHLEGVVAFHWNSASASPPAGMAEDVDLSGFSFHSLRRTTTAAPGSRSVSMTGTNDYWVGLHYLFKEVGAGGATLRRYSLTLTGIG